MFSSSLWLCLTIPRNHFIVLRCHQVCVTTPAPRHPPPCHHTLRLCPAQPPGRACQSCPHRVCLSIMWHGFGRGPLGGTKEDTSLLRWYGRFDFGTFWHIVTCNVLWPFMIILHTATALNLLPQRASMPLCIILPFPNVHACWQWIFSLSEIIYTKWRAAIGLCHLTEASVIHLVYCIWNI